MSLSCLNIFERGIFTTERLHVKQKQENRRTNEILCESHVENVLWKIL